MKTVANDIIERLDNKKISDRFSDPISVEVFEDNPKYQFLKFCKKAHDLPLPLLAKVTNKKLSLSNYYLSVANVKALCKTIKIIPEFMSYFYFDNCGLSDERTSLMIDGM
jgi:hypothetical protein